MKSRAVQASIALLVAVSLFLANTCVKAGPPAEGLFPVDELLAACVAAQRGFRPLTRADLEQAKAELTEAVARLDQQLTADGENGAAWRTFLKWDRLQSQLQRTDPDPDELEAVYEQYRAKDRRCERDKLAVKREGLNRTAFAEVREALWRYLWTARTLDDPDLAKELQDQYHKMVTTQLPEYVRQYHAQPTAAAALRIGQQLRWLEYWQQAPELVASLRRELGGPNLLIQASADLVAAAIARPLDQQEPVRDVILGTDIYGTGHTKGNLEVKLVPDAKRAAFDIILLGTTASETVGYKGPAQIYSTGTTGIGARKRFRLDTEGLAAEPSAANAKTRNRINCIQTTRGRRLVQRIAWKRALRQESTAEYIASRHAEQRVNQRLNREAAEMVNRANASAGKYRNYLRQCRMFPRRLDFSTTDKALHGVGLLADGSQLGAPNKPPQLVEPYDLAIHVHESMINNLAASAFAGELLSEKTLLADLEHLGVPEDARLRLQSPEEEATWTIVFERFRLEDDGVAMPISVQFADNAVVVTIHGRRFYKGGQMLSAMNVTAEYKFEPTEQGFRAVRQGDVKVTRRKGGFAGAEGAILKRRFEGMFEEEILLEQIELPREWDTLPGADAQTNRPPEITPVKLKTVQCVCRDGWLAIAWKRTSPDEPASPTP